MTKPELAFRAIEFYRNSQAPAMQPVAEAACEYLRAYFSEHEALDEEPEDTVPDTGCNC